jgi:hypothetical protein
MSSTCLPLDISALSFAVIGGPTTGTPVTVMLGNDFLNAVYSAMSVPALGP